MDFLGGIGEDRVMVELNKLPDSYYVINNVLMMLSKSVFWKKYREYVRSAQIDHIVVGPSGVFLIETKNWGNKTFQSSSFSPHKQIDRASLVFFLSMKRSFEGKIPTRNVVVTINRNPYLNYKYVKQVHISGLNSFILKMQSVLTISDVKRIADRIIPHCRN